jgi:hypothetical protein
MQPITHQKHSPQKRLTVDLTVGTTYACRWGPNARAWSDSSTQEVGTLSDKELKAALETLMASLCVDAEDVEDEVETATRAVAW